jgi:hypothetical protein
MPDFIESQNDTDVNTVHVRSKVPIRSLHIALLTRIALLTSVLPHVFSIKANGRQRMLTYMQEETGNVLSKTIDYRCDNRRFWLSAHNCQVPTKTSQNLGLEQQIRIFGAS